MSEWLEKIIAWQDEKLYRLQIYFNLSDLQTVWIAFLLGAITIWIF